MEAWLPVLAGPGSVGKGGGPTHWVGGRQGLGYPVRGHPTNITGAGPGGEQKHPAVGTGVGPGP